MDDALVHFKSGRKGFYPDVLILVVMDDALVQVLNYLIMNLLLVLILVVMDDALVRNGQPRTSHTTC